MGPAHLPVAGADTSPQGHHWVECIEWGEKRDNIPTLGQKVKIRQSVGNSYYKALSVVTCERNAFCNVIEDFVYRVEQVRRQTCRPDLLTERLSPDYGKVKTFRMRDGQPHFPV